MLKTLVLLVLLHILFLIILSVLIVGSLNNKYKRFALSVLFALIISLQLVSYYMTQSLIESKFIQHCNIHTVSIGYKWFGAKIWFGLILFIAIHLGLFFSFKYVSRLAVKIKTLAIVLIMLPMLMPNGVLYSFYKIAMLQREAEGTLEASLAQIGVPPLQNIEATKGKNIIILSLESYEAGYIDSPLSYLTPNLSNLKKEWNYYEIESSPNGDFTFGSLYNIVTGIPLAGYGLGMGDIPNQWGVGIKQKTKLPNLINILEAAGYKSSFFITDANFAGTRPFLNACGAVQILDNDSLKNKYQVDMIQDYELFEEMKFKILEHKSKNETFAAVLSSIGTHFPDGIYDARLEKKVPKEKLGMHFMVKATDYMIGDLIHFLKQNDLMEHTAIYIFPDHVKMGYERDCLLDLPAKLFLLSNAKFDFNEKERAINQLDLAKLILQGAEVRHNVKFLMESIKESIVDFYNSNIETIHNINMLAFGRSDAIGTSLKVFKDDDYIHILSKNDTVCLFSNNLSSKQKFVVLFDNTGKITHQYVADKSDTIYEDYALEIFNKYGLIHGVLTSNITSKSFSSYGIFELSFSNKEIYDIFNVRTNLNAIELEEVKNDVSRYIAHAGGNFNDVGYTNSLEALDTSYRRGYRLFELDIIKTADGKYVAAHDWDHWRSIVGHIDTGAVSEALFLSNKIYKKYTPLNMIRINSWFKNHPDAILITDKVNEPKEFASQFIDKGRLRMELFTLDAIAEAHANGIQSMASQNIVESLDPMKAAQILKEMGVKYVAAGRGILKTKRELFKRLKNVGIKTYLFHINFEIGRNELFAVESELEYAYGIYADNWNFSNPKYTYEKENVICGKPLKDRYQLKQLDFVAYIDYLSKRNYYIFIAAADEASSQMTQQLAPLNSKIDWKGKMRWAYIGIFNPGKEIAQEYFSPRMLEAKSTKPINYHIFSAGFSAGNRSDILINNHQYNMPTRGLHFVIYDEQNRMVLDEAFFDTYAQSNPLRNKIYN